MADHKRAAGVNKRKKMNTDESKSSESAKISLLKGLARFYEFGQFCDLTVSLGNRQWHVHKNVESTNNSVTLHDDDPDAIEALLQYFYTSDYSDLQEVGPCVFNVRMFTLAEKYLVEHLQTHAAAKFALVAKHAWNTDDFANAIREAYSSTTDSQEALKGIILQAAGRHAKELFGDPTQHAKFREAACTIPAFSASMFGSLAGRLKDAERPLKYYYRCDMPGCEDVFTCKMEEGDEVVSECSLGHTVTRSWADVDVKVEELKPFQRVYAP